MPAPARITEWIRQKYPKPTVDPDWLDACLAWISEELHLSDVNSQADEIISNVESQLLNSDLRDSMLAGTGLPLGIGTAEDTRLQGKILVQIQGMTEIGHSAFSLQNVQQTRTDRADLAGLTESGDDVEDEGPIPKFPRSMLRFDLNDGTQSLRAIEFRRLPDLELGVTPLGYKMILKDVPIRRGIAFLEPSNIELKGNMTEELEANREADFARGLRMRLGQPEPDHEEVSATNIQDLQRNIPGPETGLTVQPQRTPLREVTMEELSPRPPPRMPAREELEPPTRRRIPVASTAGSASTSSTVVSPYFSNISTSSSTLVGSLTLSSVQLSPVRREALPSGQVSHKTNVSQDDSDFDDDLQIDDAFFQELDAAEQVAMNTVSRPIRDLNARENQGVATVEDHTEVIVIDSDSDDKENMAPVTQRRVRRRLAATSDDDSDIIVIE